MSNEISFSKRVTFLSILFILPLVIFVVAIMIAPKPVEFSRSPAPSGYLVSIENDDCFDLDNGAIATPMPILSCDDRRSDVTFDYYWKSEPHTILVPLRPETSMSYVDQAYETIHLAMIDNLDFENAYTGEPFTQVAVVRTAAGKYYKIQLISESTLDIQFQWEQLR
ncbi:MAG: hypothetical protein K8L97_04085 [Anaerolineae bacterium]|nr:hypothetical protein [Anaerolineae bacterium]